MRVYNSYRAGRMQSALGLDVGGMGLFRGGKVPKSNSLFVDLDYSPPLPVIRVDPKQSAFASGLRRPLVLNIASARDVPQVRNSVVVSDAVDVVNFMRRPNAMHIEPGKAMRRIAGGPYFYADVAISVKHARITTCFDGIDGRDSPSKMTGFFAVVKFRFESVLSYFSVFGFDMFRKVCDTVVCKVRVQPNDFANLRENPIDIEPCKRMGVVFIPVDTDAKIPAGSTMPRLVPSGFVGAAVDAPSKNPGIWVVVKKFAQSFCGKIGFSHDAVLSLCGQRPGGASTLTGPRHFNTGGA